jgi:hypothetical protein
MTNIEAPQTGSLTYTYTGSEEDREEEEEESDEDDSKEGEATRQLGPSCGLCSA